jgi:hypothetical protein
MLGGDIMKNFKIMRTVCIDVAVVLLVTLIINIVLKKPVVVPIIEGVACILFLIGAYSCHIKILRNEKVNN